MHKLVLFTVLFSHALFSNHNIDPGNVQLVIKRNLAIFKNSGLEESRIKQLFADLRSGHQTRLPEAIAEIADALPPGGIIALENSFNSVTVYQHRKNLIRAIGAYKTPEAEVALTRLLVSHLSDASFVDIIYELKTINEANVDGRTVRYRPYSENIITHFSGLARNPSLTDNQRGAVILVIGEMQDERFNPVLQELRNDKRPFIRNLASLIPDF